MKQGTVISIDIREGQGFIEEEDEKTIMFLLSAVVGPPVAEEDKVSYDIVTTPERQAVNVRKV